MAGIGNQDRGESVINEVKRATRTDRTQKSGALYFCSIATSRRL
jgi:hypothetical protein